MALKVNGNEIPWVPEESVSQLLQRMHYIFPMLIVTVNGTIVKKVDYSKYFLTDNATVDVIHLISGG